MTDAPKSVDYLHGITLEQLLTQLIDHFGWTGMADLVRINCFRSNPSIRSSLTFLRRTPWARSQVELIYCQWRGGAEVAAIRTALKRQAQQERNAQQAAAPSASKPPLSIDPWRKSR